MAEQLRRELAEIVRDEIRDPRLGFVSFTEVRMSRDLSHAVIYCSVFNADTSTEPADQGGLEKSARKQQSESIEILNRAVGFIRKEIAGRIQARIVPTLKFTLDDSVVRGAAMDDLISKAIRDDDRRGHKNNTDKNDAGSNGTDPNGTDPSDTRNESN
jgi:ribosome-binding factor A